MLSKRQLAFCFSFAVLPCVRAAPTFSRDVAPILYRHCAACHRPGEFAPFSVLSYKDVAQHSRAIARAVQTRTMPPWKPEPGYGSFANARTLSEKEIRTVVQWAEAQAPEGDPRTLPAPPRAESEWSLGVPDQIVTMADTFTVPAFAADDYRCFAIPAALTRDRYVRAMEFRPSNRQVVHHALVFVDYSRTARELAARGGGSYSCFGTPGFLPGGSLGGWSPGAGPVRLPDGAALRLRAGSDIVLQLHFHSKGETELERSSVGLYFTDQAPTRHVMDVALVSRDIDIAPGERAFKVTDHFELPVDVHAVGIIPHAHYICREIKGWAILPDGRKRWLIWIKDWDFNWQDQYRYADSVALPARTRVEMEFTYDNSAANRHNPNSPPKRVVWGPGSTDEMAGLHIQVIPDRDEDVAELGQALWGKVMRMVGGSFYTKPKP